MREILVIGDEAYLPVETVASLYSVEVVWLEGVIASGLLAEDVRSEPRVCICVASLDRVATIVRLSRGLGLDLDAIAWALA
jgi:hypothetical protein